jgi:hypothetical protein
MNRRQIEQMRAKLADDFFLKQQREARARRIKAIEHRAAADKALDQKAKGGGPTAAAAAAKIGPEQAVYIRGAGRFPTSAPAPAPSPKAKAAAPPSKPAAPAKAEQPKT